LSAVSTDKTTKTGVAYWCSPLFKIRTLLSSTGQVLNLLLHS